MRYSLMLNPERFEGDRVSLQITFQIPITGYISTDKE